MHTFDNFGWYSANKYPGRVADVAPVNTSVSEKEGDLRANWTGYEWIDRPYSIPPVEIHYPATIKEYDEFLTKHIDAVAQSRGWEDRVSLMARAGFVGPWQADAIAFGQWADGCNVIGYQILSDYQRGVIQQPTVESLLSALPEMIWPE